MLKNFFQGKNERNQLLPRKKSVQISKPYCTGAAQPGNPWKNIGRGGVMGKKKGVQ
jgi:hypothetical protein